MAADDPVAGTFRIEDGLDLRRGIEVRCGNARCAGEGVVGAPLHAAPRRFLGTFRTGSEAFVPCPRCRQVNHVQVGRDSVAVVARPDLPQCPREFV
jgi:hypothetical protein